MKTYAIKIALRGVSPMIWRRLRINGSMSLADFHQVIQIVFGWEDKHLHRFHIYGKNYGIAYAGGLSSSDDAHLVFIDDLLLTREIDLPMSIIFSCLGFMTSRLR